MASHIGSFYRLEIIKSSSPISTIKRSQTCHPSELNRAFCAGRGGWGVSVVQESTKFSHTTAMCWRNRTNMVINEGNVFSLMGFVLIKKEEEEEEEEDEGEEGFNGCLRCSMDV